MRLSLLLLAFSLTGLFAADPPGTTPPPKPLPAEVNYALADLFTAEAKLKKDYEIKLAAVREKAAKVVEAAQVKAVKAGDLDGALALKAKVEEIRDGKLAAEGLPGTDPAKEIIGKWNWSDSANYRTIISFEGEGVVKASNGNFGTYRVDAAKRTITIVWHDQEVLELAPKSADELIGKTPKGVDVTLARVKN